MRSWCCFLVFLVCLGFGCFLVAGKTKQVVAPRTYFAEYVVLEREKRQGGVRQVGESARRPCPNRSHS